MKFLKRLKSGNFWISMISAVVLILQAVFNVEIKTEYLNQIILGILGLLVMFGIVSDGSNDEVSVNKTSSNENMENVINLITQTTSLLETNILNFFKQIQDSNQDNVGEDKDVNKEDLLIVAEQSLTDETKQEGVHNETIKVESISNATEQDQTQNKTIV